METSLKTQGKLESVDCRRPFPSSTVKSSSTVVFWDPRHGSPGSRHKTFVQVPLQDTGVENISELISLMEDRKLWKFTAVYRYDDASRLSSK